MRKPDEQALIPTVASLQRTSRPRRALRMPAVEEKVGWKKSTIYAEEKAGRFPRRIRLGPNSSAWFEDEIDAWLAKRAEAPVEAPRTCKPGPGRPRKIMVVVPVTPEIEAERALQSKSSAVRVSHNSGRSPPTG